jgi:aryl-alcohol dehydrogenase-like predicted oxidoreductase
VRAAEDSLRRLGIDYIDLYQTHWPDEETPLEETLAAFDSLVKAGKVRFIGASNYPAWLLTKTLWVSDVNKLVRFDTLQPHYSLLHRSEFERELQALCKDQHIGVIPYSPLAAGFLTGKYTRDNLAPDTSRTQSGLIQQLANDPNAFTALDAIKQLAQQYGVPVAHIALAWLLQRETIVAPIIGARTVAQLQELIGAVNVRLSAEDITALNLVSNVF